jgi:hypothetical protein
MPTWTYIVATPNPVGVNQEALIVFWLDKVSETEFKKEDLGSFVFVPLR